MELDIQFETKVTLTAKDMGKDITDVDKILTKKITEQYEGRCSRNGYVLPNSVKMISRSMGMVEKGRYTGDILFYAEASAKVLQPPDGIVIEGTVIRQNRMGMYIDYQGAIRVMVPRDLHIGEVEFNDLVKVGDTVRVEIKKSRYQVNDTSILSVGIFKGKVKGAAGEAAAEEKKEEEFTEVDVDAAEAEAEADAVATAEEEDEEDAEGAEDNAEEEEEEDESN
jgi:DNA-directed RNA polymerase subunit E'/Rpb7